MSKKAKRASRSKERTRRDTRIENAQQWMLSERPDCEWSRADATTLIDGLDRWQQRNYSPKSRPSKRLRAQEARTLLAHLAKVKHHAPLQPPEPDFDWGPWGDPENPNDPRVEPLPLGTTKGGGYTDDERERELARYEARALERQEKGLEEITDVGTWLERHEPRRGRKRGNSERRR